MGRLIDHAAASAGRLLNLSRLGTYLGVDGKTVDRWLVLLEHMFLIRRVRAWHRNELKRLVRTPKLHFLDSGLLAALLRAGVGDIARDRREAGAAPRMPGPFRARRSRRPVGRGADHQPLSRQGPGRSRSCPGAPFRRGRRGRSQGECDGTAPRLPGTGAPARRCRRGLRVRNRPSRRRPYPASRPQPLRDAGRDALEGRRIGLIAGRSPRPMAATAPSAYGSVPLRRRRFRPVTACRAEPPPIDSSRGLGSHTRRT